MAILEKCLERQEQYKYNGRLGRLAREVEKLNVQRQKELRVYDILLPPKSPGASRHDNICLFRISAKVTLQAHARAWTWMYILSLNDILGTVIFAGSVRISTMSLNSDSDSDIYKIKFLKRAQLI